MSASSDWRLRRWASAPHRLAFAAAGLVLVATGLWWAGVLALDAPGRVAHAPLMTFGFMPLYVAGFLFTAGPKWLQRPAVEARVLALPIALHTAGCVVLLVATSVPMRSLGHAAIAAGGSMLALRFAALVRASVVPDRRHARRIAAAMAFGVLAMWVAAVGAWFGRDDLVRGAALAAVWGSLGVAFVTAAHRLVPFVGEAPRGLLDGLTALLVVEAAVGAADALGLSIGPRGEAARAALEALAGLVLAALALRWARLPGTRLRMSAALFVGWVWFAASLGLLAVAHVARASGTPSLAGEQAALHAWTMGFLGSTMVAMVSRVAATQQGRSVGLDGVAWGLFWLLQVATLLRVGHALWADRAGAAGMLVAAAVVWAVVMTAWTARQLIWFGQEPFRRRPSTVPPPRTR